MTSAHTRLDRPNCGILLAALLCLILASVQANAELQANPTETTQAYSTARLVSELEGLVPGTTQSIGLQIRLEDGWHTYWRNPGDSASATRVLYELPDGFQASELIYALPHRIPMGPLTSFGYEKETILITEVTVPAGEQANLGQNRTIKVSAEWMVCRIECIPAFYDFSITLPLVAERKPTEFRPLFERARSSIDRGRKLRGTLDRHEDLVEVSLPLTDPQQRLTDLFPYPELPLSNATPVISQKGPAQLLVQLAYERNDSAKEDDWRFLAVLEDRDSGEQEGIEVVVQKARENVWAMLGFAFLGGLILNLMPCVFPILGLKLFSLVHAVESRRRLVLSNLVYQGGVLVSFWVLAAAIVFLQRGGHVLGWGFQLQSPGFVTFLIALFFFLGLNFIGIVEFQFRFASMGQELTGRRGYWGSFFTGLLAVLVASPCTAPFMGAAMGYALSQSALIIFLTFSALGLGLGFPYVFFACFPGSSRILPKSGPWMANLKEFMAFPLWGTAIWLLYVLSVQRGPLAVSGVLGALLLASAGVWAWRKFSRVPRLLGAGVLGIAAIGALMMTWQASAPASGPEVDDGYWEEYSAAKLTAYRKEGKPVFVNFTAAWCISCQVNDRTTFRSDSVRSRVRGEGIVMMKADWTNRNEKIGRELQRFQRAGVPLYIYYAPGSRKPVILPEVLTPGLFFNYTGLEAPELRS